MLHQVAKKRMDGREGKIGAVFRGREGEGEVEDDSRGGGQKDRRFLSSTNQSRSCSR